MPALLSWLRSRFGSERLGNKVNPLDEALYIILSKQTQEPVYRRIYGAFKRRYPAWEAVADATIEEVASIIQEAGLARQRAAHIVGLALELRRYFGKVTLAPLRRMNASEAEAFLSRLPGLGRKSAKCIMMYSLGAPALPIDVHTLRFAKRLQILPETAEARARSTQDALEACLPKASWHCFHVGAVALGRTHCLPKGPECSGCPACQWCPTGQTCSSEVTARA